MYQPLLRIVSCWEDQTAELVIDISNSSCVIIQHSPRFIYWLCKMRWQEKLSLPLILNKMGETHPETNRDGMFWTYIQYYIHLRLILGRRMFQVFIILGGKGSQ